MIGKEPETAASGHADVAPLVPDEVTKLNDQHAAQTRRIVRRVSRQSSEETGEQPENGCIQETLGYVVEGRVLPKIEGQTLMLKPGDCVVMPKGASRHFSVAEPLRMIESTIVPKSPRWRRQGS